MKKRSSKRTGAPASARPRAKKSAPEPIDLPAPKRGRGRPTTYDPGFCERVIELGEDGKSKAQIARALGCSRKSLYLWMRVHPEFKEAMDEAEFAALAWWEDVGQAGLTLPKFNAALYAFNMKNRFREFYADKMDLAHSGTVAEEKPEMSKLELARRVAFVLAEGQEELRRKQAEQGLPQTVVVDGATWQPLLTRHA